MPTDMPEYDLAALRVELPPPEPHCAAECCHLREARRRGFEAGWRAAQEQQEPVVLCTLNVGRLVLGAVGMALVTVALLKGCGG